MFFSIIFLVIIFLGAISESAPPCHSAPPSPPPPTAAPIPTSHSPPPSPSPPLPSAKPITTSPSLLPSPSPPLPSGKQTTGGNVGQGTYYDVGLGACGVTNTDTDMICAMNYATFDGYHGYGNTGNPNNNPICGKQVRINYNGKSVTATIEDRCGGCQGHGDIDMSPAVFNQLADAALGRIDISWDYI